MTAFATVRTSCRAGSSSASRSLARSARVPSSSSPTSPTGNLDSRTGREVLALLGAASSEYGQSIAMVTHDPIAASYADRILFLADGRVVEDRARSSAEEISRVMLGHGGRVMSRFSLREHLPSILVATLASAFGVALLEGTANLGIMLTADDVTGSSTTVAYLLGIVAMVFIVIAIYVGAVVTANTFSTVIAGRTRTIALLRLIGATARSQRRTPSRPRASSSGVIGALVGAVIGTAIPAAGLQIASATGAIPDAPWNYVQPAILLPVVGVVLTTWLASWVGSRRVLSVSPMQATGAAQEHSREEVVVAHGPQRDSRSRCS